MATLRYQGIENFKVMVIQESCFIIGRSKQCNFQVAPIWTKISRLQCALFETHNGHKIRDLNSLQGTAVNGVGIGNRDIHLKSGDRISIGGIELEYREGGIDKGTKVPRILENE